jgi:tape measure domain-containing protein
MADPALSILIDSSGAEAGAKRVNAALDAIRETAARTIAAIEALNKATVGGGKSGAGAGTGAGAAQAKADVSAHEKAEQQKTAISKREATKRSAPQSNPQLNQLKSDIGSLSAALSKIAAPKVDVSSITRDLKSASRELDKLSRADLSKMGDGGSESIKKLQARIAELNRQLGEVNKAQIRTGNLMSGTAPGPLTKSQASAASAVDAKRRPEFSTLPETSPSFVSPMPVGKSGVKDNITELDRLKKKLDDLRNTNVRGPLQSGFKELTTTFDGLTSAVNMGRAAMVAYGAVGLVRETTLMADGFVVLTQRIKTATDSSGDFLEMNSKLFSMSQKNGVAFKDTVGVWQNLSRSAPELGATNQDMLRLTDIVQKLGTIGGSSGDELRYALRQFGQAMSMGSLRAEEMNSLLENTPEIANAIAAGMGKTAGQLRVAVLEGKVLSKDVFQALMKQGDQVDARFSRIAPNLAQGINRIQNALAKSLGEGSGGMTTEIAKGMGFLADNMDTALNVAANLGVALAGVFGGRVMGRMASSIGEAIAKHKELSVVMTALQAETLREAEANMVLARSEERSAAAAAAAAAVRVNAAKQAAASSVAGAVVGGAAAAGVAGAAVVGTGAAKSQIDPHKELAEAQADLEKKQAALFMATGNSAVATTELAVAQKAATVAGRAWATVLGGLRTVVGALGGPIGVLITALSIGFSLYASNSNSAADAQKDFNDTLVKFIDLQRQIDSTDTAGSVRADAIRQQQAILQNLDTDISKARQSLEQIKQEATSLTSTKGILNAAKGAVDAYTGGALGNFMGKGTLYDQGVAADTKQARKQVSAAQAARDTIDAIQNPQKYEDSFMRSMPKPQPIVVDDKATLKFKELRKDLVEQIRLQRELNGTFSKGAADVAVFRQQMELASKIRAIPTDLSPDRRDELAQLETSKQQLELDSEKNQAQMQVDDEVKNQREVARAMGGGPVAARKAEARVSARQQANTLGLTDETDPGGARRKALEKSSLAVADQQTAGDFNSEARSSTLGVKAEERKLRAMQLVGIARDVEMAKIDKETDLISQFGSAAGKGAQKMIEQAGAAAKMRAEGELLAAAMDEQNKAAGATKLVGTGEIEGPDRNAQIAMKEKQIELEGRYGTVLDENAKKIIEAIGVQQRMADQRAMGEDLRASKMDTAGLQQQIDMIQKVGFEERVEMAGLQKSIELKKQYGDASSEAAQKLIEQAKNQERLNVALEKQRALNSMRLDTGAQADVGRLTLDPNLGTEDRARAIAMRQQELDLMKQYGSASDDISQAMIQEAGDQAALNDYINQHNDALAQMAMKGRDSYGMLRDAAATVLGGVEDLLVDLITTSGSAKEAFANFAKSVGQQLVRMAIQMMIIRPLAGMLMGGLAGPAAGPAFGGFTTEAALGGITWGAAHTGGVIGSDNLPMKPVTSVFSSLPKYHSGGIVGNEQPAILKRGEGVFTENQMKALAPSGGGGAVTVAPTINVTAPPGGTAEDGERFGRAMSRQIEETINSALTKQMRNGGLLNPNGMNRM